MSSSFVYIMQQVAFPLYYYDITGNWQDAIVLSETGVLPKVQNPDYPVLEDAMHEIKWAAVPSMNWQRAVRLSEEEVLESIERLNQLGLVRTAMNGGVLYVSRDERATRHAIRDRLSND